MALGKIRYIDWDMESSAIINSGVVLGNVFIAVSSILLQFLSPDKLQFLYNNGKIYWISMYALAIIICILRYYYHRKNALSFMVEEFKRRGLDKGWFLFFVSIILLIGSFAISLPHITIFKKARSRVCESQGLVIVSNAGGHFILTPKGMSVASPT